MIIAILAGGKATRLGNLAQDIPKSMLPVGDKPFIGHQLDLLAAQGIRRVHLCLGHLPESILDYVGDGAAWGITVTHTVEQKPLGTAGALALALPMLGERFGILYGDSFLPIPYAEIAAAFVEANAAGMMTVWENRDAFDRSNIAIAEGRVTAYKSGPDDPTPYVWIDYGLSFLKREVLAEVPADHVSGLSDIWRGLAASDSLAAYPVPQRFYEIGSHTGYEELGRLADAKQLPSWK